MCACGFLPRADALQRFFTDDRSYATPLLLIVGENDDVVPTEASLRVANFFNDTTIVKHDKGHLIDVRKEAVQQYNQFFERFAKNSNL